MEGLLGKTTVKREVVEYTQKMKKQVQYETENLFFNKRETTNSSFLNGITSGKGNDDNDWLNVGMGDAMADLLSPIQKAGEICTHKSHQATQPSILSTEPDIVVRINPMPASPRALPLR